MPADPTKARDFLLSSDYPLDKLVWIHERTETVDSINQFITFAHGLPFTPLIRVVWSTSPTFSTTYGVGDGPISSTPFVPFDPLMGAAWADSTDITIVASGVATYSMYLRIYAFMPSHVNDDADFTVDGADEFVLSTDYNYSKLYLAGRTDELTAPGSSTTITHGLGYYPQTELWYEHSGRTQVFTRSNPVDYADGSDFSAKITTSALTLRRENYPGGGQRFHYRIYGDEL